MRFFILLVIFCTSAIAADKPRIDVGVDPRMELLAAVQLLSGYGEKYPGIITRYGFPYKADMATYFAPYRNHRAVKLFAEMSDRFSYDAPPEAMLHLTDPPTLSVRIPFTDYLKMRASGDKNLDRAEALNAGEKRLQEFADALRNFARESDFQAFYDAHKGTYKAIWKTMDKELEGSSDWMSALEQYYGQSQASYNIIICPMFHPGGYGPRLESKGKSEVYEICGPSGVKDGLPAFGDKKTIRHLAWHEFGHSFVNPLSERFWRELEASSSLLKPIEQKMSKQAYGQWGNCVNEHIIRAVEIRLMVQQQGKGAEEILICEERVRGFAYIEPLCRKLEEYEQHRDKYPTFESFYPQIIGVFKSLSEQNLGPEFYRVFFGGTINSAMYVADVLVIPTHEADPAVQKKIQDWVERVHQGFYKKAVILSDDEALKQDLSGKTVVVYGTMTGNSWLASLSADLPFKLESDRIMADKEYPGEHLRLIAAWPNPKNEEKGIVIYTAQQAADVVGINGVFHGPTSFVVATGTDILQADNYVRRDGKWTFK